MIDITNLSKKQRKRIINQIFIKRPIVTRIFSLIDKCRDRVEFEREPRCVLFTGPSGSGKTMSLEEYVKNNPPIYGPGFVVRPIIHVKMPKNRSLKTLARRILRALEVPDWRTLKADRDTLFDYAFEQIKLQGVEVVLLDEMQHLTESAADKTLRKAADDFKELAKDQKTILVICGLDNTSKILKRNEQLERLCCYRERSEFFEFRTKEGRKEFRDFLKEVDERLPFVENSKFARGDFSKNIFKATKGSVSFVMLLISEAAFIAIDKDETLSEKHFSEAYDDVMTKHFEGLENPFKQDVLTQAA